ncbi:RAQPRD family integrative conjugative element protein [Candidatus Symbiopectobacterium sp. NZEC135]|uniref:integrative conjugative element protein, RAQPRD family n=1 Tax=Candidatus Symbiopectobacterium sp. NZEC135 TaxID=2820471 RepID=UPI002228036B|nr:RAQPRD family integrative conjugative element protein [Candidatus Symbiopectobacterium sp. NZEC135]MCW2478042.1 RAQPRD family integrative conjugative element protein [Candidatus Symbiopectobacterium sp. NZEC135]
MVLPTQLRAVRRSAPIFLSAALMLGSSFSAHADTPAQSQDLAAALRQLDALERLVVQSASRTPAELGERYYFDYPRLRDDLDRIRIGIQSHLTPSRAQPRDPAELKGNYRQESTAEHSNISLKDQP